MLLILLLLEYFIDERIALDIHISFNGHDVEGCGHKTKMCKSLQFVLQENKSNNLTIHLDGGLLKPFVYIQNKTLVYNRTLVIKQMTGSAYKPTIQGNKGFSTESYFIEFPSLPDLEMDSIIFREIKLVSFNKLKLNNGTAKINITNCIYDVSFQGFSLIYGEAPPIDFISVTINNLKLNSTLKTFYFAYVKIVNISIRDSFVTGNTIWFGPKSGILIVENCTFTGSFKTSAISLTGGDKIKLSNVDFRGFNSTSSWPVIDIKHAKKVIISHCQFGKSDSAVIDASDFETLVFSSCNFANMVPTLYAMRVVDIKNFTIENCYFKQVDVSKTTFLIDIAISHKVIFQNNSFIQCYAPMAISRVESMIIKNNWFIDNCLRPKSNSAINCENSHLTLLSSSFKKNCARKGGALNAINCTVEISSSNFTNNNADSAGTFYFDSNTRVSISNVNIISPLNKFPLFTSVIESNAISTMFNDVYITIQASNDSVDILMFNPIIKGRFKYSCPIGRKATIVGNDIWKCTYCEKGQYSLKSGYIYFEKSKFNSSFDIECKECPLGGTCNNGIFSRGNFWGYINDNEVIFIPCLKHYCCDNIQITCTNISTCYSNRKGQICGSCLNEHYIDFFSNECFPNDMCHRSLEFWFIFITIAICFVIVLAYTKDILKLFKFIYLYFKAKISSNNQLYNNTIDEPFIPKDKNNDNEFKKKRNIGLGFLKILTNFYQLNMLINVPMHISHSASFDIFSDVLQTFFTLKLQIKNLSSSFCPMQSLNAMTKLFIKDLLFILLVLLIIKTTLLILFLFKWFKKLKKRRLNVSTMNTDSRQDSDSKNKSNSSSYSNTDQMETNEAPSEENSATGPFDILVSVPIDDENSATGPLDIPVSVPSDDENPATGPLGIPVPVPFVARYRVCLLQVFLIGYTNISTFTFQMLNCVKINGEYFHYIDADRLCFTAWYYTTIVILICWVIPFSLVLYLSTKVLRDHRITVNEFIFCLVFPPTLICLYLKEKYGKRRKDIPHNENTHILSELQDSFRKNENGKRILWDPVILARRIIIIFLVIFFINPIIRLCCVFIILILYLFHHSHELPYCSQRLNNLESFCLLNLCFLTCVNLFRAFVYVYSLPADQLPMSTISKFFDFYELVVMTLPITISVVYILWSIITVFFSKFRNFRIKKNI